MTLEEYAVKCRLLRTACPLLEPHVLLYESTGWQLLGYGSETSEEPIIKISDKSFPRAEIKYREAYRRLVAAGVLKPSNVERTTSDVETQAR